MNSSQFPCLNGKTRVPSGLFGSTHGGSDALWGILAVPFCYLLFLEAQFSRTPQKSEKLRYDLNLSANVQFHHEDSVRDPKTPVAGKLRFSAFYNMLLVLGV